MNLRILLKISPENIHKYIQHLEINPNYININKNTIEIKIIN